LRARLAFGTVPRFIRPGPPEIDDGPDAVSTDDLLEPANRHLPGPVELPRLDNLEPAPDAATSRADQSRQQDTQHPAHIYRSPPPSSPFSVNHSITQFRPRAILRAMIAFRKALGVMCLAIVGVVLSARADETALGQALLDLGTDLRVMCVAAHPDDEDGATLTLYRKRYGYETYAVIGTHGEGGQNEIGPELYEELGVIRTFEMMRAAEITGAQLRFLNLPEFGYSKTLDETFEKWGREETIRRLVRVIREVKPDVIITNHGAGKDHGHHQALGAALVEAFDAAADPAVFPDLADAFGTWQAARLYRRESDGIEIDINQPDPHLGVPYSEIAARAL